MAVPQIEDDVVLRARRVGEQSEAARRADRRQILPVE